MIVAAILLKRIFRLSRPRKFPIYTSFIFAISSSFFEVVSFGLIIPLLDGLIKGGDFSGIYNIPVIGNFIALLPLSDDIYAFLSLLFIVMTFTCFNHALRYSSQFIMVSACEKIGDTIRVNIFDRFLRFAKSFFDNRRIGELHNTLLKQSEKTVDFVSLSYDMFLHSMIGLAYFGIMLFISWELTLTTLILLPVTAFLVNVIIRKIKTTARKRIETEQDMDSRVFDVISAMPLIKAYANENEEAGKFNFLSNTLRLERFGILKRLISIPPIQEVVVAIAIAILAGAAVYLFTKGNIGILASFLVYFVILRRLVGEFKVITHIGGEISSLIPSVEKVLWIFEDNDKAFIKSGKAGFRGLKDKISFENVSFSYTVDREILKGISFSIKKESLVAIIGPTGAGKTTIINLIPRFYDYTGGSIKMDGIDIRKYDLKALREGIGIVSQDAHIFNDTIKNNIAYGLKRKISGDELEKITRSANLYDFVMSLPDKYDTFVGDRGVKLSGGENQRIAIARAILKKPDILILDEATSSLDTHTERLIQNAIERLVKNKTTIIIAHRLSTVKSADWIIVLEDGSITEQGKLDELLNKRERFYHYWSLQKFY